MVGGIHKRTWQDTNTAASTLHWAWHSSWVALLMLTYQKGRHMQCDTLSRLPDHCVELDHQSDIMWSSCVTADWSPGALSLSRWPPPSYPPPTWAWRSCDTQQPGVFLDQHAAMVYRRDNYVTWTKTQTHVLSFRGHICRETRCVAGALSRCTKEMSWWSMAVASSLADTSPCNPNNRASVALLAQPPIVTVTWPTADNTTMGVSLPTPPDTSTEREAPATWPLRRCLTV